VGLSVRIPAIVITEIVQMRHRDQGDAGCSLG
jgi:hypothetical protein